MKKYFWFWNVDYKRHLLLKYLSKNRTNKELRLDKTETLGKSFEDICKKLKVNRFQLHGITSELYESEEILYTNVELKGIFGKRKGIESYYNRKYIKRYFDLILNLLRNFVQIFIPIASLSITILVLSKDMKKEENKMNRIEQIELEHKKTYKSLQNEIHKMNKDLDSVFQSLNQLN